MLSFLFIFFSLVIVISSLVVILNRNPLVSAVSLILTLFCTAVIFAILEAHFVAAIQVLLYAGAIMVLFVFVIMLIRQSEAPTENVVQGSRRSYMTRYRGLGIAITLFFLTILCLVGFSQGDVSLSTDSTSLGGIRSVARVFLRDYFWVFELTSVLLSVAIVGAVVVTQGGKSVAGITGRRRDMGFEGDNE